MLTVFDFVIFQIIWKVISNFEFIPYLNNLQKFILKCKKNKMAFYPELIFLIMFIYN